MCRVFTGRSPLLKTDKKIFSAFALAALASVSVSMSGAITPAYAQDTSSETTGINPNNIVGGKSSGKTNSNLEVFGGGMAKAHTGGFGVGNGLGAVPGAGTFTIKKDALEQVTWYKSRRQVSIEDDGPIVTRRSGGGGMFPGGLSPATFGGSGAITGALNAPHNLQQANFGRVTARQSTSARPLMHSGPAASQSLAATSHGLNKGDGTQNRSQSPGHAPAPAQAGYSNYGTPPTVGGDADYAMARAREVKAKLLGTH